jgi:formylglycine-generating enzyme required for sulfatase activity
MIVNVAPVGTATLGVGKWGQLDLAGSVWEWDLDWYANFASCTDCAYLTGGSWRSERSGHFYDAASFMTAFHRAGADPSYRFASIGIRCARSP